MTPILDPVVAAFVGEPCGNLGDIDPDTVNPHDSESGRPFICQNGVRPGEKKLAQFRQAMKLRNVPLLYATEDVSSKDTLCYVKLFDPCGSRTWFVCEFSPTAPDGCTNLAYGLVHGFEDEWGYINLEELAHTPGKTGIGIEIDCWFKPTTMSEILDELAESEVLEIESTQE
jgi:hypothetical protein